MAEFKISRLRFSWAGEWEDQKAYNKDEIVQFNGKAYVCLIPHTSNGFYNDLQDINPKWDLMMTGQTWKGIWEPVTFYSLDNIVIFGGIVYKCNTEHLSGVVLDLDIDKWDVYAESKTWQSEWTSATTYGVGDIVYYGGSSYECIRSHISADTDLEGLEVDYLGLDSTEVKWKLVKEGLHWRGVYAKSSEDSSQLRYKLNDLVKFGPSVYRCIEGYAPSVAQEDLSTLNLYESFDETKWELWVPGLDFDDVWNEEVVYQPGDVVLYGGYLYQSLVINNIGNVPSFNANDSTDDWELITKAYDVTGEWNADTYYKVGSVVTYGGDLYVAITDSTNEAPGNFEVQAIYEADGSSGTTLKLDTGDSTDYRAITVGMTVTGEGFATGQSVQSVSVDGNITTVILSHAPDGAIADSAVLTFAGTDYVYWELMIPGFNWEGKWVDGKLYNQDDVAYYGNATYVCTREHTSALVNRPDLDLQQNYWNIYLQHDKTNALTQKGEIIVFEGGEKSALAIGSANNVLKVVGDLPQWRETDFTPNVYYVATNGVDDPSRGTTPDTAWRTIRYACDQVAKGTKKQNEKALLDANKEWVIEEMFYWFLYQQNQNLGIWGDSVNFDNEKTRRDARFVYDGVVTDLARGQNAETVRNTLSYFDLESTNKYTNDTVADQALFFSETLATMFNLIELALTNTAPVESYQVLEGVENPVQQYFNTNLVIEPDTITIVQSLEGIIRTALEEGNIKNVPPSFEGAYTTINIKSGTYEEQLPIVVPARTALNGDELRGAAVQPANPINTLCTRTFGFINQFVVGSTVNMEHNTRVQFVSLNPIDEISTVIGGDNIVQGVNYYVIGDSITDTTFSVAAEPDGEPVELLTNIGYMYVYGGNALNDMFYVRNATGIRNMTLTGLLGTLSPQNEFETRRPTGGAFVSLDPGDGPDDTRAWITTRSPYIQNVTNFGLGCVGGKIDSTLHNGGNRSMTSNDFTQVISDGIGIWCTGGDALTECVSVFSYYNYAGYFAENGGRIRATNGNSSYGKYGCVAEGFDAGEIPATGTVNNRDNQAQANAVSALGANAEILKLEFAHAGEEYYETTTNLLKYSNEFIENEGLWVTDGNLNIIRAATSPFENETAWEIEGTTSLTDSSYFYQDVAVSPQGRTYTGVSGTNISGSGEGASFNVTVFSERYVVSVNNGGVNYVVGNQILLPGTLFGGRSPENDITVEVASLSITSILTINHEGTVPEGSALPYTASIYAKKDTAQYIDLFAIFSGYETRTSRIRFNFDTEEVTTYVGEDGGVEPASAQGYYVRFVRDGWFRISFTFWDDTAQNTSLRFKVYPRGIDGIAGTTNIYGPQVQINDELTFFLATKNNRPTAHANVYVNGAGRDVQIIADELRTGAVYQTRLLENAAFSSGGTGYKFQRNNAQTGNTEYLTLAQSEVATPAEYEGMRLVVASGKGAGQYGIISRYSKLTKRAYVLKESFESLEVVATNATTDRLELNSSVDFDTVYVGQKIQFTPTYYDIEVTSTAQDAVQVLGTLGDLNNYMYVTSTARLRAGQKINFTGETFGGVITGFDYYIINVIDDTTIQISTTEGGGVWPLTNVNIEDPNDSPIVLTGEVAAFTLNYPSNTSYLVGTSTADMQVGYPIQFTGISLGDVELGTTYYIHDIYNETQFSISANRLDFDITATTSADSTITTADTSGLIPLTSVLFKDIAPIGGLIENKQYWINNIVDGTDFTISDTVITRTATATQSTTNLITVDSTAGFIAGTPVTFTGTTFGGITNDRVYYIQVVNDATSFTISETPSGAAVPLLSATGAVIVRTLVNTVSVTDDTGTTPAVTVGEKEEVAAEGGRVMGAQFFTETFGSVVDGASYYVLEKFESVPTGDTYTQAGNFVNGSTFWDTTSITVDIDPGADANFVSELAGIGSGGRLVINDSTFGNLEVTLQGSWDAEPTAGSTVSATTIETSPGVVNSISTIAIGIDDSTVTKEITIEEILDSGTPFALTDAQGSMQIGEVGWDHINPGYPLVSTFDSTSVYNIEPRLQYAAPPFTQEQMSVIGGSDYTIIGSSGFTVVAFPESGNGARSTSDGINWDIQVTLPISGDKEETIEDPLNPGSFIANPNYNGGWVDVAYGDKTWVLMSRTGQILYSVSDGLTWLSATLPSLGAGEEYSSIAYGNGAFVAVARGSSRSAYSLNNASTWTLVNQSIGDDDWVDIAYGNETFVAISGSNHNVKYSTDNGATWTESTLDTAVDSTVNNWSGIEFGNGRFVAVSTDERSAAYSFDGITWNNSNLLVKGNHLKYGNGVFLLLDSVDGVCRQSEDGFTWKVLNAELADYIGLGYTIDNTTKKGFFITTDSFAGSTRISTGARAQARASVDSTIITGIGMLNTGSGYDTVNTPTLTIIDPNNSEDALTQVRVGNGSLGAPSFVNYGSGYNTTSTTINIVGSGYSDSFQTGLRIVVKDLTRLPQPGDNIQFEGNDIIYRVATADVLRSTRVPNLECEVQISPTMTQELSPAHNTPFTMRSRFSQVRLTNHDFLNIGFGNEIQSNYPGLPETTNLEPQDEVQETNNGRVFYSSTDQDGNFRVGDLFAVEQATGIVTLSADEFGLDGLTELSIGGVALGGSPVVITQFSTDGTFVANSNNLVPTQRAIKTYLASRLSQGGSDTFTGLLTAGTVKVGGPDEITSTVEEGAEGWQVKIGTKANIQGAFGNSGWAGDGLAMAYFMKTFVDPTRSGQQ